MDSLHAYGAVAVAAAVIAAIGLALRLIDPFIEDEDKDHLKRKFEDFWFSVAILSTTESVGEALRSRYKYMKSKRLFFLQLYWLFLFIMFISICFDNYAKDPKDIQNDFTQSTVADFSFLANARYLEAAKDIKLFCMHREVECAKYGDELAWRKEVSRIAILEGSYNDLLNELAQNPFWLRFAADAYVASVIIFFAFPLSLSLFVSFNLTLWLLSLITSSSFKLIVIVCIDFLIAIAAPVVLLNIFLLIGAYINVISIGGFVDFTYYDTVSMTTLIIGQTAMQINLSLLLFAGPAWLVYMIPDWGVRTYYLIIQTILLRSLIYKTVGNFIDDTWRFAHFDFSPTYTDGAINFAIITDLIYSLAFVLPGLGIVLIYRWPFGQRTFLNIVQWFPEHPKGPYYAISRMFLGLADEIRKLWPGE